MVHTQLSISVSTGFQNHQGGNSVPSRHPLLSESQTICFLPPKTPLFCTFHTVCDLWCLTSLNWLLCERYIRAHFLLLLNNIPLDENSCVWALGSSYFLAILNVWLLFIVWLGFFFLLVYEGIDLPRHAVTIFNILKYHTSLK